MYAYEINSVADVEALEVTDYRGKGRELVLMPFAKDADTVCFLFKDGTRSQWISRGDEYYGPSFHISEYLKEDAN